MDVDVLESRLAALGEPAYRARQIWEWVARGAPGFAAMSNVPARLRTTLADEIPFSPLTV